MFLYEFKELANLIRFRILARRLDGQWAYELRMDILPMATLSSSQLESECGEKAFKIAK